MVQLLTGATQSNGEIVANYFDSPSHLDFSAEIREVDPMINTSALIYGDNYNLGFLYHCPDGVYRLFYIVITELQYPVTNHQVHLKLMSIAFLFANELCGLNRNSMTQPTEYSFLQDFNYLTPALQIVYVTILDRYIVSSPKMLASFYYKNEMTSFLTQELRYSASQLELNGKITVLNC